MKKMIFVATLMLSSLCVKAQTKEQTRAQEGQIVWVIINVIKDESKADYLAWMNATFLPAISQSTDVLVQQQYKSTRWLEPKKQNADKTWTYSFIMDPVVPNANYDIEWLLKKTYGDDKGIALYKTYLGFFGQPLVSYVFKQTKI